MNDVAVGVNAAHDQFAIIVLQRRRFHETLAAAFRRFVPGGSGVFHLQRDRLDAVTVFGDVIGDRIVRLERRGENKCQFVLANGVARSIFRSRFRPGIGERLKTKSRFVKVRRLFGVADIEFDVIGSLKRKKIRFGCGSLFRSCNCRWHKIPSY